MKINKRQLRKIIQEERARLRESAELASVSSADAVKLYTAMKGLGTTEVDIEEVFSRRASDIPALNDEYSRLLAAAGERGDLADWLASDGMRDEAALVRSATGQSGDASIGDRMASGGGLGNLARTGKFDPVAIATGGVGSMDNLLKGPFGEGVSDSRRVVFTKKALRRRILREFYGRDDDEFGTVKVTRGDLNRVIVEELALAGMIGKPVSGALSKMKGMFGRGGAAADAPTEMTSVPVTDAEKVHAALQLGDPESDPGFMDVMARRMEDMNVLNDEYAAHLSAMGQAGDLVSSLEGAGLAQQARAMMGHIRGLASTPGDRQGMLKQMIREELSFFLNEAERVYTQADHASAMSKVSPQSSDVVASMPAIQDPSPGPFVDPQASADLVSSKMRDALSGISEDDEDDVDEMIELLDEN